MEGSYKFKTKKKKTGNCWELRLCLVAVKRFPENTYFPEMLIFGKGKCFHMFGCISKNFPENIFWCLEKKKENTNQKTQSHNSGKKIINDHNTRSQSRRDRDLRSRSTARSRSRSDRDRQHDRDLDRAIAIRDRDRAESRLMARSRSRHRSRRRTGAGARDLGLDLLLSRPCALSLSLSFSGNDLKGK